MSLPTFNDDGLGFTGNTVGNFSIFSLLELILYWR